MELSSSMETDVKLPFITADASGPKHMNIRLTRAKMESLVLGFAGQSGRTVPDGIKRWGDDPQRIDEVILVGLMTRMPAVQDRVKRIFGKEPHKGVNPDEVVAIGAAIQAGFMRRVKDVLLLDEASLSLVLKRLAA